MDEIIVNEGVTQGWMQVPLSPKEVGILKQLPEKGKHEFTENVHRYIETVGDDYKVTPPVAVPAQEPAGFRVESIDGGVTFHVILPPELSPSITSMVPGGFGTVSPPEATDMGLSKESAMQIAEERIKQYGVGATPFVPAGNKWVMHEDEGVGMTEEEMERVISVLKALPAINIEEVLRSSTSYSEGEKR